MTKTLNYETLMAEINKLQKQAEVLRSGEVAEVIANIQKQVKEYGLTAKDIGVVEVQERVKHTRRKPEAKFRNPVSGETWAGRGKLPKWLQAALSQGKKKEEFMIA